MSKSSRADTVQVSGGHPRHYLPAGEAEKALRAALDLKGAELLKLMDRFGSTDGNDAVKAEVKDAIVHAVAMLTYAAPLDR